MIDLEELKSAKELSYVRHLKSWALPYTLILFSAIIVNYFVVGKQIENRDKQERASTPIVKDINHNGIKEQFYLIKNNQGQVIDTAFISIDGKHINDYLK